MRSPAVRRLFAFAMLPLIVACDKLGTEHSNQTAGSSSAAPNNSISAVATPKYPPATGLEGSRFAGAPQDDVLFIADEDHQAIRVLPLPLGEDTKVTTISVPGHPAQVIASRNRVLVTIRDMPDGTGALLVLKRDGLVGLNESARIPLPSDAWGLAISADESLAVITSAWTGKVSIVDIDKEKVRATVSVGREPRGITILPDGKRAYISHLTSSTMTRLTDIDGPNPTATPMEFPAAPMRSPQQTTGEASLGYTVVANPTGERLFFARHGLDTFGGEWFGSATVAVWPPRLEKPLVGKPPPGLNTPLAEDDIPGPTHLNTGARSFVQPRAAVYRPRMQTLLVASEGLNDLVELDALMSDPSLGQIRRYNIGVYDNKYVHAATKGGAPSGNALSADEEFAYVHCRSTDDVVAVRLIDGEGRYQSVRPLMVRLVDGTGKESDESYALGRALFYDATDEMVSGRLACTGCHPDGRDDGHVWHETQLKDAETTIANFIASTTTFSTLSQKIEFTDSYGCGFTAFEPQNVEGDKEKLTGIGYPRQTPMIAGRVDAAGPYGWHGESPDLAKRIEAGFLLHRWRTPPIEGSTPEGFVARAGHLAKFIRTGLVAPKKPARPLTEEEQRGKTIFESPTAQCSRCHVPGTGFTDRTSAPFSQPPLKTGFAKEENTAFKTPSLLNVVGTAPYFHDGRFATLEELVEKNADRMGKTSQLSAEEKKALVAYLETL